MSENLSVTPKTRSWQQTRALLLHLAATDRSIYVLEAKQAGLQLVFFDTPQEAARVGPQLRTQGLSETVGMIDLERYTVGDAERFRIRILRRCSEESARKVSTFALRLLRDLGPVWAVDDDTGEDLDALASSDPARLLFPDEG